MSNPKLFSLVPKAEMLRFLSKGTAGMMSIPNYLPYASCQSIWQPLYDSGDIALDFILHQKLNYPIGSTYRPHVGRSTKKIEGMLDDWVDGPDWEWQSTRQGSIDEVGLYFNKKDREHDTFREDVVLPGHRCGARRGRRWFSLAYQDATERPDRARDAIEIPIEVCIGQTG